jgi:hypothetical protein
MTELMNGEPARHGIEGADSTVQVLGVTNTDLGIGDAITLQLLRQQRDHLRRQVDTTPNPASPTASNAGRRHAPRPHPTSSTRSPGWRRVAATSSRPKTSKMSNAVPYVAAISS